VPVEQGGQFTVQAVDSLNDAGRVPAVALDKDGNPAITYLLLLHILQKGELPVPIVPGQPQPPAVLLATRMNDVWTRFSLTKQGATPLGTAGGQAEGISFQDGTAGPVVHTSLVLDGQGKHHAAWSAATGLYYDTDTGGAFGDPQQVVGGQTYGAAIAVDSTGTPWISFYQNGLRVAHLAGGSWTVDDVAPGADPGGTAAADTAIGIGSDGSPMVAYGDAGATHFARSSGGTWSTEAVGAGAGGLGLSMAVDQKGDPHLAYYEASGAVHLASSSGPGSWSVSQIGRANATGGASPNWSTGIGVDGNGLDYVAWANTRPDQTQFWASPGGSFRSEVLPDSLGGANPTLAVTPDGKTVAIAWYDSVNQNLELALPSARGLALAFSPSPFPTAGPATTPAATCQPNGTTVSVMAKNISFDTKCLAAPASQAFTIDFDNQDAGVPHNVDVYTAAPPGGSHLGGAKDASDVLIGPGKTTYDVQPLKAGTYYFQCDIHPTQMFGTFVVK